MNEESNVEPENKQLKRTAAPAVVLLIFAVFGVMALVNRGRAPATDNLNQPQPTFSVGETVTINFNNDPTDTDGLAVIAIDEATLDQLVRIAQSGDNEGVENLFSNRKVFSTPNGTKVRILQDKITRVRIRVIEGATQSSEGWTQAEFLHR